MWDYMWGWNGGWGWMGMHLLWWVLIIAGLLVLFRSAGTRQMGRAAGDRSFEILRERYARGEIDKRELDERMRHLTEGGARPE